MGPCNPGALVVAAAVALAVLDEAEVAPGGELEWVAEVDGVVVPALPQAAMVKVSATAATSLMRISAPSSVPMIPTRR
jgi:predicted short-subunit dehydrogenase-like oxidoreductase (DUF2520 family)